MIGASGLTMPPGIPWVNQGTTGMPLINSIKYSPPDKVLDFIMEQACAKTQTGEYVYGKWEKGRWECDDFCFLAASDVRYRYPGQYIGIAIGNKLIDGNQVPHAVNCLWFYESGKWETRYIDATFREKIAKNFTASVILPLPISGTTNHMQFEPIKNLTHHKKAAFDLDKKYEFDDIPKLTDQVEETLIKWATHGIPIHGGPVDTNYYLQNDRVINWYIHIRQEHKGAPIGMAFGIDAEDDYGCLVLWKNKNQYIFWDIDAAEGFTDFSPRVVFV